MKTLAIIPARMASTRFPGKPLALIKGKPMITHVIERARDTRIIDAILVATDSEEIAQCVRDFHCDVEMTRSDHASGFDRVVEAAARRSGFDVILNIQGDEPGIHPATIAGVIALFEDSDTQIGTSAVRFRTEEDYLDPDQVKVVTDVHRRAMYFSRSPVPHLRNPEFFRQVMPLKHQGIYGYRAEILPDLAALEPALYEQAESLEQLRFLYAGYTIRVHETSFESIGVDRPEDIRLAEDALSRSGW